jgi:hypothetical protein
VAVEALLPQASVEAFPLGVVRRLAGSAQVEFDTAFIGPLVHNPGNELVAIVDLDGGRQTALCGDTAEGIDHVYSLET